jgi:hypothetical protein
LLPGAAGGRCHVMNVWFGALALNQFHLVIRSLIHRHWSFFRSSWDHWVLAGPLKQAWYFPVFLSFSFSPPLGTVLTIEESGCP